MTAQLCFTVNHEVLDEWGTAAASAVIALAKSIAERRGWKWDGSYETNDINVYWIDVPDETVPDVLRELSSYSIVPVYTRFDDRDEDITDSDARKLSNLQLDYKWGLNPEF